MLRNKMFFQYIHTNIIHYSLYVHPNQYTIVRKILVRH